ncbi:MAG: hypothetical protein WKG07_33690 [Hymenobacter sp.]
MENAVLVCLLAVARWRLARQAAGDCRFAAGAGAGRLLPRVGRADGPEHSQPGVAATATAAGCCPISCCCCCKTTTRPRPCVRLGLRNLGRGRGGL